jgi:hypothetical protein
MNLYPTKFLTQSWTHTVNIRTVNEDVSEAIFVVLFQASWKNGRELHIFSKVGLIKTGRGYY